MDEPAATLSVNGALQAHETIQDVKKRGPPIVLIGHDVAHVFEVADRISIHRLAEIKPSNPNALATPCKPGPAPSRRLAPDPGNQPIRLLQ
jgi:ABC-type sugar transport system ATPase subunit